MKPSLSINKALARKLAQVAKRSEEHIRRNNACIQSLRDTILVSDKRNLLFLKAYLIEFTERETEKDFKNNLIGLYLKMIDRKLNNKPVC